MSQRPLKRRERGEPVVEILPLNFAHRRLKQTHLEEHLVEPGFTQTTFVTRRHRLGPGTNAATNSQLDIPAPHIE